MLHRQTLKWASKYRFLLRKHRDSLQLPETLRLSKGLMSQEATLSGRASVVSITEISIVLSIIITSVEPAQCSQCGTFVSSQIRFQTDSGSSGLQGQDRHVSLSPDDWFTCTLIKSSSPGLKVQVNVSHLVNLNIMAVCLKGSDTTCIWYKGINELLQIQLGKYCIFYTGDWGYWVSCPVWTILIKCFYYLKAVELNGSRNYKYT